MDDTSASFSEEAAGQAIDDLLVECRRLNETMRATWAGDDDGLRTRLRARLAVNEAASQFIVALKPLLPNNDTLSADDRQRIYPLLERLLHDKLEADLSASWGLIIQASCSSDRNLVTEDEDTTLCTQINLYREKEQSMLNFVKTLDNVPIELADVLYLYWGPFLAPDTIPSQILGMVLANSERIRRKPSPT